MREKAGRLLVLGVLCCLCLIAPQVGNHLPHPKGSGDGFREDLAMEDLLHISKRIGTRAASQREIIEDTREYVEQTAKDLQITAKTNGWNMTIQHLVVDGKYNWKAQYYLYKNLHHLLIRMEPFSHSQESCQGSLLVNVHLDSAVGSPGAGDDGIAISIALESIRTLSQQLCTTQQAPLLFLFNNGEELGLLGSHGLVTRYPDLISSVGAFINLEAAGTFGPESLFQASAEAPWLIDAFASAAPYPRGSVVAQDLFQAGIIPSDTDFRVFTRVGNLYGIDMALYRNGYLYHTPRDDYQYISEGTLQHFGSNVLSLISYFSEGDHKVLLRKSTNVCALESKSSFQSTFFDVGGVFMVHYGSLVHNSLLTITISMLLVNMYFLKRERTLWVILYTTASAMGSFICPFGFAFLMGNILQRPMLWFSSPWLALVCYSPLALLGNQITGLLLRSITSHRLFDYQTTYYTVCSVLWVVLACLGSFFHVGGTFFALLFAWCNIVMSFFHAQYVTLWLFSIPMFLLSDIGFQFLETIVPITGRAGLKPVELIVGGFCGLFGSLLQLPILPFQKYDKKWREILFCVMLLFIVGCVMFNLAGRESVYSITTPKRVLVQHMNDLDSGDSYILFVPADCIPFQTHQLPERSFPQAEDSERYHSPLATIPSLKPEQGNRWEMPSPFVESESRIHVEWTEQHSGYWTIELEARHAFSTELWIKGFIEDTNLVSNVTLVQESEEIVKVRLFDGSGDNHFRFFLSSSSPITVEVFFNYIPSPASTSYSELSAVSASLPDYFAPVSCYSFRKKFCLGEK